MEDKVLRTARVLPGLVALAVVLTIGLLALGARPAAAATTPQTKPVVTAVTDVACGTATVSIVLAEGVTGIYNARVYANGEDPALGNVASTGTIKAEKTFTFEEDSYGGQLEVWVVVFDGPESDYRPKTIVAKVDTNCKRPARPVVESTGPMCDDPNMTIKVTNPNLLVNDQFKVRIGADGEGVVLTAGASTEAVVTESTGVYVKRGRAWLKIKWVQYVEPTECPTTPPTTTPPTNPPATTPVSDGGSDDTGGGASLPVTGVKSTVLFGVGGLLVAAGIALLVVRRRRDPEFIVE